MVNIKDLRFRLDDIDLYTPTTDEPGINFWISCGSFVDDFCILFDTEEERDEVLNYLDNHFRIFKVLD